MLNHTDVKKTRAVIDLNAIAGNYTHTAKACAPAKVAAVVKADAYGHGALAVAKRLNAVGCDFFTVSNIDEALELRTGGITGTILVLGYVLDEFLPEAVENDISLAVDTVAHLKTILRAADGRPVKIHIKLDTGMNRTGFFAKGDGAPLDEELHKAVELIEKHPNLVCEGIFSHFAVADEPEGSAFTETQYARFTETVEKLRALGLKPTYRHICNSAGIVRFPQMHLDAVRMEIGRAHV